MNPTRTAAIAGFIKALEGMLRCVRLAQEAQTCGSAHDLGVAEARWVLVAQYQAANYFNW